MKKAILPAEIDLALQPSRLLLGYLGLISILAVLCIWIYFSAWLALLWSALVLGLTQYFVRQKALLSLRQSWLRVHVDVFGQITVQNHAQQRYKVGMADASVVHPMLLVLHLKHEEPMPWRERLINRLLQHNVLLILPDQVDADALRKLRVWLRWGKSVKVIEPLAS